MTTSFADLGVPAALVARLSARGIEEPFPIQEAALPDAFARRDVVGKAPTGSGKTLAFGLALVAHATGAKPRRPRGLVLVPTRELAAQVQKELAQLTPDKGRRVLCIYGGTSYNIARKALATGVDIVVACPGRLEDMLEQRALDLSDVTTVVVDEADRMADMGFLPAVRRIVSTTPSDRHVLLFSATMGPDVQSLVREFTHDAAVHDVVGDEAPSDVEHFFWRVPREQRSAYTAELANQYDRAIVFTRTKHGADRLARQLEERGISAVPIHGDRTQAQRERALRNVKSGQIRVLVATDVAARGIHIEALPVVIHFDPPAQATDYLHRSGRTGRAGATGAVYSLVGDDVVGQVRRLQKALGLSAAIESPEEASGIRLGAVDDTAATERLDDRPQRSSARPASRPSMNGSSRGPSRDFGDHRRERPERSDYTERATRSERTERSPRIDRFERTSDSRRTPAERRPSDNESRPARSDRPRFERTDKSRAPRESLREPRARFDDQRTGARGASRPGRGTSNEAVVQFFNDSKGYGFAKGRDGEDLFIHFSNIVGDGFKSLETGQRVTYEVATGPKGLEARNVRVVSGRARR